jgi:NADP-dependent 3-hydroxy acid dehydrogenase YdfG
MASRTDATQALNVLVTGSSSGLGEEIAYGYARRGAKLALFARRRERLEHVARACLAQGAKEAIVLAYDTTSRSDIAAATKELDERWGRIDRAFLNAGGGRMPDPKDPVLEDKLFQCCSGDESSVTAFSADSAEWIMRLNYLGVVYWLEPLLERMRKQRSGTIAVTGSLSADGNLLRSGPYTATKVAVRALLEGLRFDALKFGVRLCLIESGWFVSELTDPHAKVPFLLPTAEAAAQAVRGVEAGKSVIRFPWQMSVLSRMGASLPRGLRERILDRYLPPIGP